MANENIFSMFPEQLAAHSIDVKTIVDHIAQVLHSLTVVLGILGNGLVICVAGFCMSPKVTNVWLVNLAVADFTFCLTRVLSLVEYLFFDYWPFGVFMCKFNGYFKYTHMLCSVFLLCIISLDRTLSVWCPVRTKQRRTISFARLVCLGVWVLAVALSSPYFVFRQLDQDKNNLNKCTMEPEKKEQDSSKSILYALRLIPFLITFCCYTLSAVGICCTRLTKRTIPLKILVCLMLAFFLCWTPYHCFLLAKMLDRNNQVVKFGFTIANGLACFNSCVNPLLYFCMGFDRRTRLKRSLGTVFRRALT